VNFDAVTNDANKTAYNIIPTATPAKTVRTSHLTNNGCSPNTSNALNKMDGAYPPKADDTPNHKEGGIKAND
jgi:hypothetical protein